MGKSVKGKITISRTTSNTRDDDFISIEIKYGGQRIKGEMELKDYALMISGLSLQPIEIREDI